MLKTSGNQIQDAHGKQVAFKGMSLFWSQWYGQFYNAQDIQWLVSDWKVEIIRAAMAVKSGGYAEDKSQWNKIQTVVDACVSNGIYVIIDWHVGPDDPMQGLSAEFWAMAAAKYANVPNVLFEIFNEPGPDWGFIKSYHTAITQVIRNTGAKNIIILGTPNWSQDVDVAANDRVEGDNLAYTLHFYAATHKQSLRDKGEAALAAGLPLWITEWGTCEASGDGALDFGEAQTWLDWAASHGITTTNWGVYDKSESCAALNPGASGTGGWNTGQISQSGNFVKSYISGNSPPPIPPVPSGSGCCSWDDGYNCAPTTDYCKQKDSCEQNCQGRWVTGCCSWDGGSSCGPTTEYCKQKDVCEQHCQGQWKPMNGFLLKLLEARKSSFM